MTIRLMRNKSQANYLTKDTEVISTRTGTLKRATSITDPTIILESNGRPLPANVNYFHIPDFSRYYFVTAIQTVTNGMYAISGHVDVLVSFRSQINPCVGIVARNEYTNNLYLDDPMFRVYQNPRIQIKMFPRGLENPSYALIVAGNQT